MSMHLFTASSGATNRALSLITSYENGCVKLWRYRNVEKERSIEGIGWECLWSSKLHVESGKRSVKTLAVPALYFFQLTHLRNRYDSHGNSGFSRPFYRPVGVGRPPCRALRFESVCLTPTSSELREQINSLQADPVSNSEVMGTVFRTKHPGNGAVAFHDDGRVCAVGGWDGRCVPPTKVAHY
jgi:ASTRA-associated protein 1